MERKKSKNTILFPTTLNMDQFMGSTTSRKTAASDRSKGENIYELRGVLLHKGASAYHGHYEAQVFDAMYVFVAIAFSYIITVECGLGTKLGFNSMTRLSRRLQHLGTSGQKLNPS